MRNDCVGGLALTLSGLFVLGSCAPAATHSGAGLVPALQSGVATRASCGPVPRGRARCFALVVTVALAGAGAAEPAYGPADLQAAYALPSASRGSNQMVAVVDAFDDPSAERDLAAYRRRFGLRECTTANGCFRKVDEYGRSGLYPHPDPGWAGEISLDLDMVSAGCPNCKLLLVESDNDSASNLSFAVRTAAQLGARVISNSYGYEETASGDPNYDPKRAIVVASTGDDGWVQGPQEPAAYGTVIAVGGTSLRRSPGGSGWLETAWSGSGSACSQLVARPSWIPPTRRCGGKRPYADVSAVADPAPGVLVYQSYGQARAGFYRFGGTSVSAPLVAAIYALAENAPSLNYGASLYAARGGSLTDVLSGSNGTPGSANRRGQTCTPARMCVARSGWDGPTGNGSPWGIAAF